MIRATRRVPGLTGDRPRRARGRSCSRRAACTDDTGTTASVETAPSGAGHERRGPGRPDHGQPHRPLFAADCRRGRECPAGARSVSRQAGPQSNLPNPLGQRTCTWSTAESPPRSVAVSVVTTESASLGGASGGDYTAAKLFEDTKPLAEGLEPIDGLGDDAFFGAVAGMQVSVARGRRVPLGDRSVRDDGRRRGGRARARAARGRATALRPAAQASSINPTSPSARW